MELLPSALAILIDSSSWLFWMGFCFSWAGEVNLYCIFHTLIAVLMACAKSEPVRMQCLSPIPMRIMSSPYLRRDFSSLPVTLWGRAGRAGKSVSAQLEWALEIRA